MSEHLVRRIITVKPDGTKTTDEFFENTSESSTNKTERPTKYGRYDTPPPGKERDCNCGSRFCGICG